MLHKCDSAGVCERVLVLVRLCMFVFSHVFPCLFVVVCVCCCCCCCCLCMCVCACVRAFNRVVVVVMVEVRVTFKNVLRCLEAAFNFLFGRLAFGTQVTDVLPISMQS